MSIRHCSQPQAAVAARAAHAMWLKTTLSSPGGVMGLSGDTTLSPKLYCGKSPVPIKAELLVYMLMLTTSCLVVKKVLSEYGVELTGSYSFSSMIIRKT